MKLFDKMYKYEMDATKTVGATEWTQNTEGTDGQMDRQTNGRTDGVKPIYPPTTSLCGGYNYSLEATSNWNIQSQQHSNGYSRVDYIP